MKRFILKTFTFLVVFICALLVISKIMNRDNNSMTREIGSATLPIVRMQTGVQRYNEIHGMLGETDVTFQRDTITVLGVNRELHFSVEMFDTKLTKLSFQVRSIDGSRLIEDTEVFEYKISNQVIQVQTSVKDLIEKDKEYALIVVLTDEKDRTIRYYTRMLWSDNLYAEEKLSFVREFHEKTFDTVEINDLVKYMESNSKGNNTTLHKVDIHSSLSQLGWGELEVRPLGEAVLDLKDINGQTASIQLQRIVTTGNGKKKVHYFVDEVYRIRYTTERVYLLNFDRTMTQIPDLEGDIYINNKIYLGIVSEEIPLRESEDGNIVVFEVANRLCSYNMTTNKLAILFSFYDKENMDARSIYRKHGIEILDVNEAGNVQFVVYGYMNRGRHEGEVGIQLYSYDGGKNTIEESVYIPYEKTFEILDCEIQNLLYWNREGILYLYLNHTIYAVNTLEKTAIELAVMEDDQSIEISSNHKMAAWHQGDGLCLMNLSMQRKVSIPVSASEKIYALGFMAEDLIYGVAREEDIAMDSSGRIVVPMYKVCICDGEGVILKQYMQDNIYVTDCEVNGNQITLARIERQENGKLLEIPPEHIMNNVEVREGKNKLSIAAIDIYERVVQVEVRNTIDGKNIKILTPKEVVFEGGRNTVLPLPEFERLYYVYDRYGVPGIFRKPSSAFQLAYDNSGIVIDERGKTIWIKGNRVAKNQIMAIKEREPEKEKSNLAVCLDVMLKHRGVSINSEELLGQGMSAFHILDANLPGMRVMDLTGCNLDCILYFTNQDIPVLGILDEEAVLIVGFNQYNIVILEPETGKLIKKGIQDSTAWFEKQGNRFLTYYPLE